MVMTKKRDLMPATGAYETLKSINSSMNDLSTHFLEYRSYIFNICCIDPKIYPWMEYLFLVVVKDIKMVH